MAAVDAALTPASEFEGGALVAIDPNGQEAKLSLRKYHIDVHIEDGFARTTIDQTYFNHVASRLEGTFYFPLPADASLSRLAMYVGPRLFEGGMTERGYARQVFETIKSRALDPALLEWIDGSTFKMRVFPLEGRQEKRIILSYTQPLETVYGRTQYRFPAGHTLPRVREWSLKVNLTSDGGPPAQWNCPSHALAAQPAPGALVLTAAEQNVAPNRDVVLAWSDSSADSPAGSAVDGGTADESQSARFCSYQHDGARYVMVRYRPALKAPARPRRRDWVFLFESSADRNPLLARTQIEALRGLLENAEHDDTFQVLTAAARTTRLTEPRPLTPENIAAAIKKLEQTHLVGALDLEQALRGLGEATRALERPVVVHLGSAVPVLGARRADQLNALADEQLAAAGAAYVGVGVGKRWNRGFMRHAAAGSGGYFTQINPDEQINWRAFDLLATLNTPRLLNIGVMCDRAGSGFSRCKIPWRTAARS